ncbi:sensor histidine kinase [Geodermatophilus sp. SYSU D00691]
MITALRSTAAASRLHIQRRVGPGRVVALLAAVAVLAGAPLEARHTVLAVAASLGFMGAGAGFLLRHRVTGTRSAWDTGCGLILLGLHRPASVACDALVGDRAPVVVPATAVLFVLAAAAACLRAAAPHRPRRRAVLVAGVGGAALTAALVPLAAGPAVEVVARGASVLLVGVLWSSVAVAAWRGGTLDDRDRASTRALAGIALAVGVLGVLKSLPAVLPVTAPAVQTVADIALLAVAVTAVITALRRLDDALAGQERYAAGLLEQLAGHERHLQAVRACLHDSRAVVAGVRAGSSAVRHLPASPSRADLEAAVAAELGRLERMLRLPERPATAEAVDLDQLLRPLVVSHRERGLRVAWAPVEHPPVVVDGDALAVIVSNLLGNALAHAPKALCHLSVDVDDRLTVTVADDGPGLPPARRAAVFEAGARRSGSPGEGLGLAISRDLARRHGGDLVAQDVATGTRFVLTLPATPAPAGLPTPRDGQSVEAVVTARSAA